jgi:hypothetical protein
MAVTPRDIGAGHHHPGDRVAASRHDERLVAASVTFSFSQLSPRLICHQGMGQGEHRHRREMGSRERGFLPSSCDVSQRQRSCACRRTPVAPETPRQTQDFPGAERAEAALCRPPDDDHGQVGSHACGPEVSGVACPRHGTVVRREARTTLPAGPVPGWRAGRATAISSSMTVGVSTCGSPGPVNSCRPTSPDSGTAKLVSRPGSAAATSGPRIQRVGTGAGNATVRFRAHNWTVPHAAPYARRR